MLLKKLELFGFKSFASKTTLEFSSGITAVVGPNGCGKSNLSDAIKWVLGEQSPTQLRGYKMEDVIFNGTDKASPLNIAEVSLSLSNSDHLLPMEYEEIVITRRGFRSGESEYYINKTQVRLKDVLELFMGTGIGTIAYSLMDQGRIDLILSARPQDRRYVFEEASGITKYKARKKEALRKLEATQINLQRIDDIIKEVTRQINSIKRQVKMAEKYNLEFDKLKQKQIKLSCCDYLGYKERMDSLSLDTKSQKSKCEAISEKLEAQTKEIAQYREESDILDKQFIEMQEDRANLTTFLENNRNRITLNEIRMKEQHTRRNQLSEKLVEAENKKKVLRTDFEQNKKCIDEIENQKQSKGQLLDKKGIDFKKTQDAIQSLNRIIPEYKTDILDLTNQETKVKNELSKIYTDLEIYQARKRRLETELEELNNEKSNTGLKLKEISDNTEQIKKEIFTQEEVVQQKQSQIDKHKHKLNQLSQELNLKIETLQKKIVEIEMLEQFQKIYDGIFQPISSILETEIGLKLTGIYNTISNLIEINPTYERCIKNAFEDKLETLVVEDVEIVSKLLSYLKSVSERQIKILLLNQLKKLSGLNDRQHLDNHRFIQEKDFESEDVKPATEFVKVKEDKFFPIINFLLHDTYIVKDLEDGLELIKANPSGIKLVTLNGDLLTCEYIKIGTDKEKQKFRNFLSQKNLENMRSSTSTINFRIEEIKKQTQEEKSKMKDILSKDINKTKNLIASFEVKINEEKLEFDRLKSDESKIVDEILITEQELKEINEEIEGCISRQGEFKNKLNNLIGENNNICQKLSSAQNQIFENTKNRERFLIEKLKLQSELNTLSEKYLSKQNMQKIIEERLDEQSRLYEEILDQISQIEKNKLQLEEENLRLKKDIEDSDGRKTELVNKLEQQYQKRNLKLLNIQSKETILDGYQKEYLLFKDELNKFDIDVRELFFKMENIKENVKKDYKVSLEKVLKDTPVEQVRLSQEEKEKELFEIEKIRKTLDSMGAINLLAIEEHKELNERFEFLNKQRKDLEDSKLALHKAIQKINRTTKELFMDTFQKVQKEFHNYFRLIFGGGRASLNLIDESDALESGIDIIAQPPDKRLQGISLLSGGEKTLCAVALLFALFKVKPSPFCILDEIDASLDDANVARFNQLLKEFTRESQFIIITHNKKTISMSDVMYGVTMEESGISKIVSVRFAESKAI